MSDERELYNMSMTNSEPIMENISVSPVILEDGVSEQIDYTSLQSELSDPNSALEECRQVKDLLDVISERETLHIEDANVINKMLAVRVETARYVGGMDKAGGKEQRDMNKDRGSKSKNKSKNNTTGQGINEQPCVTLGTGEASIPLDDMQTTSSAVDQEITHSREETEKYIIDAVEIEKIDNSELQDKIQETLPNTGGDDPSLDDYLDILKDLSPSDNVEFESHGREMMTYKSTQENSSLNITNMNPPSSEKPESMRPIPKAEELLSICELFHLLIDKVDKLSSKVSSLEDKINCNFQLMQETAIANTQEINIIRTDISGLSEKVIDMDSKVDEQKNDLIYAVHQLGEIQSSVTSIKIIVQEEYAEAGMAEDKDYTAKPGVQKDEEEEDSRANKIRQIWEKLYGEQFSRRREMFCNITASNVAVEEFFRIYPQFKPCIYVPKDKKELFSYFFRNSKNILNKMEAALRIN